MRGLPTLFALLLAACGVGTAEPAQPQPPAAAPGADTGGGFQGQAAGLSDCLWLLRSDPVLFNLLYPDADAVYYIAALPSLPGLELSLQGEFPHARYLSFVSYNGFPVDALKDSDIPPLPGHANPYLVGADRRGPLRSYRIRLRAAPVPAEPGEHEPGVLYTQGSNLPLPNPVSYLFYRLYLPDAGSGRQGGVALPKIELAGQDLSFIPVSCETLREWLPDTAALQQRYAESSAPTASPAALLPGAENPPVWTVESGLTAGALGPLNARLGLSGGPGSNPHNRYIAAALSRAHGALLVIHARAPTAPATREAQARMDGGDLRYWSICQNSRSTRYLACLSDSDILREPDGSFTLVVSSETDRPATARNWLPFGPEPEAQLLYRHMLPSADFYRYSAQAAESSELPLEMAMGPYFPLARYCNRAAYEADRCGFSLTGGLP